MQLDAKRNFFSFFSGYLHTPLTASRVQADIDDFYGPHKPDDDPDGPPKPLASSVEPDELNGGRSPLPQELPLDPWEAHDLAAHVRPITPFSARLPTLPLKPLPPDQVTYSHGGGGDSPVGKKIIYLQPHIAVDYKDAGDPLDARVTQVNMLHDNDIVTTVQDNDVVTDSDPASVVWPEHAITPIIELTAMAKWHDPNPYVDATTTPQDVAQALQEHAHVGSSSQPGTTTLHEGVMVDGVAVGSGTPPPTSPSNLVPTPPVDSHKFDSPVNTAVVETGGNESHNFAAVVDNQGAIGTMIVLGDSYRSDVIHQTNVLVDHSAVVGTAEQAIVQTGGNQANNIAEFVKTLDQNPYDMGYFGGLHWHVDRVNGDYYDVNLTRQLNVMQDNDKVQQTASDHFKFWETGGNGQDNVAVMDHSGTQYDLVVVTGDYFGANWIFQTNVLLNSDYVLVNAGAGGAGTETVSTGANWLMNSAMLLDYSGGSHALTPEMQALVSALQHGDTAMGLANGFVLPGDGSGVMNVLFITGNYYDINVLEQTNIVSDSDVVMQTLQNGESGYVATGGNQLGNDAVLATIGPLNGQYVGGTQYSEATLVQTNIIVQSADVVPAQSTVVLGDPSKLAPEAAALVTHSPTPAPPPAEESSAPHPVDNGTHTTSDPLSSVLS